MEPESPIGVFDSGVGGLSVLQAIRERLPSERLIYVADSANAPYGDKPLAFVRHRSLGLGRYLQDRGVKGLVVACNTATAAGIEDLRAHLPFPVVGMEPGIKPALAQSKSGVIAVLGTRMTLQSPRYDQLVERTCPRGTILGQACDGLVEHIECGRFDDPEAMRLLRRYIEPLVARGADTLVLGCTHYPLMLQQIRDVAGKAVSIVDTGPPVARHLKYRLQQAGLLRPQRDPGAIELLTTGETARLRRCLEALQLLEGWPVAGLDSLEA